MPKSLVAYIAGPLSLNSPELTNKTLNERIVHSKAVQISVPELRRGVSCTASRCSSPAKTRAVAAPEDALNGMSKRRGGAWGGDEREVGRACRWSDRGAWNWCGRTRRGDTYAVSAKFLCTARQAQIARDAPTCASGFFSLQSSSVGVALLRETGYMTTLGLDGEEEATRSPAKVSRTLALNSARGVRRKSHALR